MRSSVLPRAGLQQGNPASQHGYPAQDPDALLKAHAAQVQAEVEAEVVKTKHKIDVTSKHIVTDRQELGQENNELVGEERQLHPTTEPPVAQLQKPVVRVQNIAALPQAIGQQPTHSLGPTMPPTMPPTQEVRPKPAQPQAPGRKRAPPALAPPALAPPARIDQDQMKVRQARQLARAAEQALLRDTITRDQQQSNATISREALPKAKQMPRSLKPGLSR